MNDLQFLYNCLNLVRSKLLIIAAEISHCIEYYEEICTSYESECFVINGTSFCQKTSNLNENSKFVNLVFSTSSNTNN